MCVTWCALVNQRPNLRPCVSRYLNWSETQAEVTCLTLFKPVNQRQNVRPCVSRYVLVNQRRNVRSCVSRYKLVNQRPNIRPCVSRYELVNQRRNVRSCVSRYKLVNQRPTLRPCDSRHLLNQTPWQTTRETKAKMNEREQKTRCLFPVSNTPFLSSLAQIRLIPPLFYCSFSDAVSCCSHFRTVQLLDN
jgi:hypothetical protein